MTSQQLRGKGTCLARLALRLYLLPAASAWPASVWGKEKEQNCHPLIAVKMVLTFSQKLLLKSVHLVCRVLQGCRMQAHGCDLMGLRLRLFMLSSTMLHHA